MTKARDIADFKFENITDTGTEGTKVASGTTAQRGSTTGQIRFNSTTGLAEYYTGTEFKSIDAPPTISSIDVTEVDSQAGGNQTIVITGSGFASGATVTFIGNSGTDFNASTVTVDSNTQITAVAPKASFLNAQEPYGVKVTNVSGLSATLASQINVDSSPSWSTASGTLATIQEDATGTHATVSATDPDGDTIVYSETGGTVLSTNNFTLNSSTGAISGDPVDVSGATTHTFTLRATAGSKTADRSFNIIVNPIPNGTTAGRASRSCKKILDDGYSTGNGLYYVTNHGTISATQHYCLMDTSYNSGGWTLLYSMSDGNGFASGTNYSFSVTTGSPSISSDYGLDRRNTFTPSTNDQFLLRREDNNDWVRHVVSTWSPTANNVSNGWETTYSVSGNNTSHPQWGEGTTYNSSGSNLSLQYFNGCALAGNCATGGDGSGFGNYQNWLYGVAGSTAYGGAYAGQSGSPIYWGANNNINGTRITMWYRKDGTQ